MSLNTVAAKKHRGSVSMPIELASSGWVGCRYPALGGSGDDAKKSVATKNLSCLAILDVSKVATTASGGLSLLGKLAKDGTDEQKKISAAAAVRRLATSIEARTTGAAVTSC